jgi:threonine synthase
MWRFGPLLPFDISNDPDSVCSLGEGYAGYGANPTGSFKDCGMSVVVTMARYYGLSSLAVTT